MDWEKFLEAASPMLEPLDIHKESRQKGDSEGEEQHVDGFLFIKIIWYQLVGMS